MTSPRPDPSAALEAAYRVVAGRMAGLPVVNPALAVEAVGFRRWEAHWLGIVVTPWFMNLTLAPAEPEAWVPLALGAKRRWRFPAGDFEFIGAQDPGFGEFAVCSLFSPMERFADQGGAALVARLALEALFDPAQAEPAPAAPAANDTGARAGADPGPGQVDRAKRDFLRGRPAQPAHGR